MFSLAIEPAVQSDMRGRKVFGLGIFVVCVFSIAIFTFKAQIKCIQHLINTYLLRNIDITIINNCLFTCVNLINLYMNNGG